MMYRAETSSAVYNAGKAEKLNTLKDEIKFVRKNREDLYSEFEFPSCYTAQGITFKSHVLSPIS